MTGRVSLYFENTIIITRLYNCEKEKKRFIEQWRRLYGKGFGRATIVDEPAQPQQRSEYDKDPRYEEKKIWRERKKTKLPPDEK